MQKCSSFTALGLLFFLVCQTASAEEVIERYPGGAIRARYSTNATGAKSGDYAEYFENGQAKIKAVFSNGKLTGAFEERFPDGKLKVRSNYREGALHGTYEEFGLIEGRLRPLRAASYREGVLHGEYREYTAKGLVKNQFFSKGTLIVPRTQRQIDTALAQIDKLKVEVRDRRENYGYAKVLQNVNDAKRHAERQQALRELMKYRCIAGVPYADLWLDYAMIVETVAAADLCQRLDRLTHSPTNPGIPSGEFQIAERGCGKSNLYFGSSLLGSVPMFMYDSDPSNIDRAGHRRWCLNPSMQKTGFGAMGKYGAMWAMDSSRPDVPDYEMVAFPPQGYMPRRYFSSKHAWSVQMNKSKFEVSEGNIQVRVFPAQFAPRSGDVRIGSEPLKLNHFTVSTGGFGAGPAIIFRPEGVQTNQGSTYAVVINGVKSNSGDDYPVKYLVLFY